MSVKAMARVQNHGLHNGSAYLLLLALADWADDWGFCLVGSAPLAQKVGVGEEKIDGLLDELERIGEIRILRSRRDGGERIVQVITGLSAEDIADGERLSPLAILALESQTTGGKQYDRQR